MVSIGSMGEAGFKSLMLSVIIGEKDNQNDSKDRDFIT